MTSLWVWSIVYKFVKIRTFAGYIFRALQHFVAKLCSFSNFDNFFLESSFFIPKPKISLLRKLSIHLICVVDDTNDGVMENVMNDVMLKREEATTFYERDRRSIDHECYEECCKWEEVRESFKHNLDLGVRWTISVLFYCFIYCF